MISFHDFCLLMGYHDVSIDVLNKKKSDIMAFDPKTKIKRSNSVPSKKFVPEQNRDSNIKIVPDDFFEQQNNNDEPVVIEKKDLK